MAQNHTQRWFKQAGSREDARSPGDYNPWNHRPNEAVVRPSRTPIVHPTIRSPPVNRLTSLVSATFVSGAEPFASDDEYSCPRSSGNDLAPILITHQAHARTEAGRFCIELLISRRIRSEDDERWRSATCEGADASGTCKLRFYELHAW